MACKDSLANGTVSAVDLDDYIDDLKGRKEYCRVLGENKLNPPLADGLWTVDISDFVRKRSV